MPIGPKEALIKHQGERRLLRDLDHMIEEELFNEWKRGMTEITVPFVTRPSDTVLRALIERYQHAGEWAEVRWNGDGFYFRSK